MKRKGLLFVALTTLLCVLTLCCVACSEKPHEHQIDDSGFCVSCDEAINPTKGVSYKVSSDDTYAEVVGYSGESSKINIASTYENLPVKNISNDAFKFNRVITKVLLPESVTSIGNSAFSECSSLQTITFGENSQLESIGKEAFYNCKNLISIEIPSGVTKIEDSTFYYCESLQSVIFGENSQLESIGEEAFYNCKNLISVEILSSVTNIGRKAFSYCDSLQSLPIGENSQLESIGEEAFIYCKKLISVEIPASVTSIEKKAFYACISLQSITVSEDNNTYKSIDSDLYTKDGTTLIQYAIGKTETSFAIPSSVISIEDYAFYNSVDSSFSYAPQIYPHSFKRRA